MDDRSVLKHASVDVNSDSSQETETPTYGDLIAFFEAHESLKLPQQQIRNRISALTQYLLFLGLDHASSIGNEIGDGLEISLSKFLDDGVKINKSAGTLANSKTFIRAWAKTWLKMRALRFDPKFDTFHSAVRHYLNLAKKRQPSLTLVGFVVQLGLEGNTSMSAMPDRRYTSVARYFLT